MLMLIMLENLVLVDHALDISFHQRTKHISVRYHFIRDLFTTGILQLVPILSAENIADILTKRV